MSSKALASCKPPLTETERGSPTNWRQATLGDIITLEYGRSLPDKVRRAGRVAVYGSNGVVGAHDAALVPNGGIIVGRKGTAGSVTVSHTPFWPIDTTYFVKARQTVDWGWLAATLHHARLNELNEATGVPGLNRDKAYRQPVLLPPLDEQRRIAEVLRSVDEAIAANEAVAVQARRSYQVALAELVGSSQDHWNTVCLGQIATFVNGRGFKPHEWGDEGLPIIRIQNLNGGTDFNYYNGDFNPKILVRPGDLLFAWSGSRGTSFGPHIWRGPEGVLNYHTWNVLPNEPEDRDFLYFALRNLTKKIEDEAHGASALVHMQKAYVVDYEISLPPLDERHAIAGTLIDLQEAAAHAGWVHREAQAMKAHLMSDLLSGHVRVPA
jgi:restriction endonuclease S subunit